MTNSTTSDKHVYLVAMMLTPLHVQGASTHVIRIHWVNTEQVYDILKTIYNILIYSHSASIGTFIRL
jgi:hypothetical protein